MVRIESFADVETYVQEAIAELAQSLETRFGAEIQGARGAMEAAVKKEMQEKASARIDLESRLAGTQQALEDAVRTLGVIQGGLMPMLEPRLFQIEQLHRGLENRVRNTEAAAAEAAKAGAAAPETFPGPASPVKEDPAHSPNAAGPQRFPMGSRPLMFLGRPQKKWQQKRRRKGRPLLRPEVWDRPSTRQHRSSRHLR